MFKCETFEWRPKWAQQNPSHRAPRPLAPSPPRPAKSPQPNFPPPANSTALPPNSPPIRPPKSPTLDSPPYLRTAAKIPCLPIPPRRKTPWPCPMVDRSSSSVPAGKNDVTTVPAVPLCVLQAPGAEAAAGPHRPTLPAPQDPSVPPCPLSAPQEEASSKSRRREAEDPLLTCGSSAWRRARWRQVPRIGGSSPNGRRLEASTCCHPPRCPRPPSARWAWARTTSPLQVLRGAPHLFD